MKVVATIITLFTLTGALLTVWLLPLYHKLSANESLIRAKEDEIDAIEPEVNRRTSGTMTTEKQRLAQIEQKKKPLLRDLERLKQERQFLIDKLPFFKR